MNSIKIIITAMFALLLNARAFPQTPDHAKMAITKTESFKVGGNCDMCKIRIEKAAKVDGVSEAEWNRASKVLTLVYNPAVVSIDLVQKRIASVGHDTEKYKADDKVYNSLPGCCHYKRIE